MIVLPEGFERTADSLPSFPADDAWIISTEIARIDAKSILEFGPGESTELFAALGLNVTTLEHDAKWYKVAKKRFKNTPNIRVLKCENELPVTCSELGNDERFDIAFVDAPQGWVPARKILPGLPDCNRFNTCLFALQRAPVVLLHDACRPLERCTLSALNAMGYRFDFLLNTYGLARIWNPAHVKDKNRVSVPSPKKSRRSASGHDSEHRGIQCGQRSG